MKFKKVLLIPSLLLIVSPLISLAQLSGWGYKETLKINEVAGKTSYNLPVLLEINTQALISAGKMQANGFDIRFSKTCDGTVLRPYWIESGLNTTKTLVWVNIDTLPANGSSTLQFYYGNATALKGSDSIATFPLRKVITSAEVISDTLVNYDWFEIKSGATATFSATGFPGKLTMNIRKMIVAGTLDASGMGYLGGPSQNAGTGPGKGYPTPSGASLGGGGGAGYGGDGGKAGAALATNGAPGIAYGTNNMLADIAPGSGGGGGYNTAGGNGGAQLIINAVSMDVSGLISSNGADGIAGWYTGGGGSGGGILVKLYSGKLSGTISARGGNGGNSPQNTFGGGGGGGGRIKIFYENTFVNTGTLNVNKGLLQASGTSNGANGNNGTSYTSTGYLSKVPTYSFSAFDPSLYRVGNFTYSSFNLNASFTDLTSYSYGWKWYFGDGATSTVKNPAHTYLADGTYNVCLKVDALCGPDSFCRPVTVMQGVTIPANSWTYKVPVHAYNPSSKIDTNYQVFFYLNTAALINAGKLKPDASDLRFSKDCNMSTLFKHYIESGVNTTNTKVWVRVDTIKPMDSLVFYMFYGNPSATNTSNFNATFPRQMIVSNATVTSDTLWNYDYIEVKTGASVTFVPATRPGKFSLRARIIKIDGTIDGSGGGYTGTATGNGNGPGGGKAAPTTGGGGAGYGGNGGKGSYCCSSPNYGGDGGLAYDNASSLNMLPGSGGGPPGLVGSGSTGGDGGAMIMINGLKIDIKGTVTANGNPAPSTNYCGGGGSGGGILTKGKYITFSGNMNAKGGNGGSSTVYYGGGGGGGGRIKIFYESSLLNSGIADVSPGNQGSGGSAPAMPGNPGSFFSGTYTSDFPRVNILPEVILSSSDADNTICSGNTVTFTASAGYKTYVFLKNNSVVQSSASRTYSTATLADGDRIQVRALDVSTCGILSNIITTTVKPAANAGLISNLKPMICSGDSASLNLTGFAGTLQWQDSSAFHVWQNVSGATAASFRSAALNDTTYYRVFVTNGGGYCLDSTKAVKVRVNPSVTAGNVFNDTTICIGNLVNLRMTGGTGGIQWQDSVSSGSWASVSGGTGATTSNYQSPALTADKYFRVKVNNVNNTCFGFSSAIHVTVDSKPSTGTASLSTTVVCSGKPLTLTLTGATGSLQWQDSLSGGSWNPIFGGTGQVFSILAPSSDVFYRATMQNGTCLEKGNVVALKVNPSVWTGVLGPDTFMCAGHPAVLRSMLATGNLSWQDSSSVQTWTNSSAGTGFNTSRYTTENLFADKYFRLLSVNTNNTCRDTSRTVKVSIASAAVAGIANGDTVICQGNPAIIKVNGGIGNIQWQDSSALHSWQDIASANSASLNTGMLMDSTWYRAVYFLGGGCTPDTSTVLHVYVKPKAVSGTVSSDSTLCEGTMFSLSTSPAIGTIQWQQSFDNISFVDTVGQTANTFTISVRNGSTYYKTKVDNNGCIAYSNTVLIRGDFAPQAGLVSADTTICSGAVATLKVYGSAGSIQWQSSPDNTSYLDSVGQNAWQLNAKPSTTRYFRAKLDNGVCSSAFTGPILVTVNPYPVAGSLPSQVSLCKGNSTLLRLMGGNGTYWQWQDSSAGLWKNILGENTDSIRVSPSSDRKYRCQVFNGNCSVSSASCLIKVDGPSVMGIISADTSICKGGIANIRLKSYTGNIQWQTSSNNSVFADSVGQTSSILLVNSPNTRYYRAKVKNGVCPAVFTSGTKVQVDDPAIAGSASPSRVICAGDITSFSLSGSFGNIQWQDSVSGSAFQNLSGKTMPVLSYAPASTRFVRARVKNGACPAVFSNQVPVQVDFKPVPGDPGMDFSMCKGNSARLNLNGYFGQIQWQTSKDKISIQDSVGQTADTMLINPLGTRYYRARLSNGVCPADFTGFVKVTVDIPPAPGTITAPVSVCRGDMATLTVSQPGSLQWEVSPDSINFSIIPGAVSTTITDGPVQTSFYRVKYTNGACVVYSGVIKLKVDPITSAGNLQASKTTLCAGDKVVLNAQGSTGTIDWQSFDGSTWNSTGMNQNPFSINPLVSATYRASVKSGVCSAKISNTVTLSVSPAAVADTLMKDQVRCTGKNAGLQLKKATGTLQWQQTTDTLFSWNNMNGITQQAISVAPSLRTYYRVIATLGSCRDTSNRVVVQVNTGAVAGNISVANDTLCAGAVFNLSVNGSSGNIRWQRSMDQNTWIGTGTGSSLTDSMWINMYYRAIADLGVCSDTTSALLIHVFNPPVGGTLSTADTIHCTGTNSQLNLSGSFGNISWESSLNNTNYTVMPLTGTTIGVDPQMLSYYRARLNTPGCPAAYSNTLSLKVTPGSLSGQLSATKSVFCIGLGTDISLAGNRGNMVWEQALVTQGPWSPVSGVSGNNAHIDLSGGMYYRVKVQNGMCPVRISDTVFVKGIPKAVSGTLIALDDTICKGSSATLMLDNFTGMITWQQLLNQTWVTMDTNSFRIFPTQNLTSTSVFRTIIGNAGCADTSSSVKIVTVEKPVAVNLSNLTPEVCEDGKYHLKVEGANSAIQWEASLDGKLFADVQGETKEEISGKVGQEKFFRVRFYPKSSHTCEAVYSDIAMLKINPLPSAGLISGKKEIKPGEPIQLKVQGYDGQIQWQNGTDTLNFRDLVSGKEGVLSVGPFIDTWYRVKADNGKCIAYSRPWAVVVLKDVLQMHPVPAVDQLTVSFTLNQSQEVDMSVFDVFGKMVKHIDRISFSEGSNNVTLNIQDLARGTYYIKLRNGEKVLEGKFVKME